MSLNKCDICPTRSGVAADITLTGWPEVIFPLGGGLQRLKKVPVGNLLKACLRSDQAAAI